MLFSVQEEILRYFLSVSPPPSVQNEAQTSSLSLSLSRIRSRPVCRPLLGGCNRLIKSSVSVRAVDEYLSEKANSVSERADLQLGFSTAQPKTSWNRRAGCEVNQTGTWWFPRREAAEKICVQNTNTWSVFSHFQSAACYYCPAAAFNKNPVNSQKHLLLISVMTTPIQAQITKHHF